MANKAGSKMDEDADMKLNDRLAELRRERELTLRDLRERVEERTGEKLSISYLSELERTETMPSIEILVRLARAYDMTANDLLAPVDFFEQSSDARYPESLRQFAKHENIGPEWLETLSRIEYRGHRPETLAEWQAIYGVLKLSMEPKVGVNDQ